MNRKQLAQLKRLHQQATPGPWKAYKPIRPMMMTIDSAQDMEAAGSIVEYRGPQGSGDYGGFVLFDKGSMLPGEKRVTFRHYANAQLIAVIRNALPEILEILEAHLQDESP